MAELVAIKENMETMLGLYSVKKTVFFPKVYNGNIWGVNLYIMI